VLKDQGALTLAVEDPSAEDDARVLADTFGLKVVGVPVDEHGWDLDALERSDADDVVLTPSHQWPVGTVMDSESRTGVVRWARSPRPSCSPTAGRPRSTSWRSPTSSSTASSTGTCAGRGRSTDDGRLAGPGSGRPGLIFGYSALTERTITEGVRLRARAMAS
jgi:hypothetical protein